MDAVEQLTGGTQIAKTEQAREARMPRFLRWFGIVLILETGLIHYLASTAEYQEAAYMGYLFVVNFLCALLAAYGIYRNRLWGWLLGAGVAAGSLAGYIWSRTNGMPGMAVEEWITPYGVVSLAVEGLFLISLVLKLWWGARPGTAANDLPLELQAPRPRKWIARNAFSLAGLLVLVLISVPANRWDDYVTSQIGQHQHVGSLGEVCSTPVTSADELREKYGIEVALVVPTAMDSFVDVRLRILDPDKAHALLVNQAAILVDQQELVLAPHLHNHNKIKPGKLFLMFFPDRDKSIHTGSQVSLVFGKTRTAPFLVP